MRKNQYRIVTISLFIFVFLNLFLVNDVWSQANLNDLVEIWKKGEYREAALRLVEYREGPYGRSALVDYLIATSLCRIPELKTEAMNYFLWILNHYLLDSDVKNQIRKEMNECREDNAPTTLVFVDMRRPGSYVAGVRGKTYYWRDRKVPIASNPVVVKKEIPRVDLLLRLFKQKRRVDAVKSLAKRLGPSYKVASSGSFLLASSSQHSLTDLQNIRVILDMFLAFFISKYEMNPPSHLITVYLVSNGQELKNLAEKIHGIGISDSSIGYSFRDDLSIIGWIPRMLIGTLAHELFHLVVRSNFGDIPPWMDEGISALYEVSKIEEQEILGLPNWRGAILRDGWRKRQKIERLIQMDWNSLDAHDRDGFEQAINHATARYFILYLQEKKKLIDVFTAFRKRKVNDMEESPMKDAVKLLETIVGSTISLIDENFTAWFNNLPDIN